MTEPGSALGNAFSAPSVAQVGNSSVIAVQGGSNSLQFWWQPIGSRQWNQEVVAGAGSGAFSAPSVAQVGNSSVIAAQGIGNSLQFWWQPMGGRAMNSEVVASAGSGAFSAPSVTQLELLGDRRSGHRQQPSVLVAAHRQPAMEPRAGGAHRERGGVATVRQLQVLPLHPIRILRRRERSHDEGHPGEELDGDRRSRPQADALSSTGSPSAAGNGTQRW